MKITVIICAAAVLLWSSCKKDTGSGTTTPAPKAFADFLKNTQWVGTLDKGGYQYAPPCCLRFSSTDKFVIYAPFFFPVSGGGFTAKDSLTGRILSIDSLPDGRTSVKTSIEMLNETILYISDRKSMTSSTTSVSKPNPFKCELFTAGNSSVKDTRWSGPLMTGGPTSGFFAYPDLSSIGFLTDGTSVYYRNGVLVPAQPTPQLPNPGVLKVGYLQYGAMVFMSGYNETNLKIVDYFGVLMPDGTKMMVHSGSADSRLPYYLQTIAWYGPIGTTPVINKQ